MFKDEYNKLFDEIKPSAELSEETLALMNEAQQHPLPAIEKKKNKKLILPLCLSGAAAMLAVTIGLSFWLNRPKVMEDGSLNPGDINTILGNSSTIGGNAEADADAMLGGAGDGANKGENNSSAPESGETLAPESGAENDSLKNNGSESGSSSSDADNVINGSNGYPKDENTPNDDAAGDADEGESTPPALPVDPREPVVMEDRNTETYLSIKEYLDALSAKKTIGYSKNYLSDESLIIVPSWLPQNVRFRQFYAYANGAYAYSYLLTDGEAEYFLNISVGATFPKTMRDLQLRIRGAQTEEVGMDKRGHQRIYYFGNYDEAIVSITTLAGEKVTQEQADALLSGFELARCTPQNGLTGLTYK